MKEPPENIHRALDLDSRARDGLTRLLASLNRAARDLTRVHRDAKDIPARIGSLLKRRISRLRREISDVERLAVASRTPWQSTAASGSEPEPSDESLADRLHTWERRLQRDIRHALSRLPMGPATDLVVRAYVSSKDSVEELAGCRKLGDDGNDSR